MLICTIPVVFWTLGWTYTHKMSELTQEKCWLPFIDSLIYFQDIEEK